MNKATGILIEYIPIYLMIYCYNEDGNVVWTKGNGEWDGLEIIEK